MSKPYAVFAGDVYAIPNRYDLPEYAGDAQALPDAASQRTAEFSVVVDDDQMVDGVRVLASGWYDANSSDETADEFAERLFREARAAA